LPPAGTYPGADSEANPGVIAGRSTPGNVHGRFTPISSCKSPFFTIFDSFRVVSTIRHMINYRFSPDEKLCKEGGKRRISERNRAPLHVILIKGKHSHWKLHLLICKHDRWICQGIRTLCDDCYIRERQNSSFSCYRDKGWANKHIQKFKGIYNQVKCERGELEV
jgi:hypothetical protein